MPVGAFSTMRYTEEHAYGQEVLLWRHGHTLVGLFLESNGLQGDTPTGELEDVAFDPKSGTLAFTARLLVGRVFSKEHPAGIPSCAIFRFRGVIMADRLAGALDRADGLETRRRTVTLPRRREGSMSTDRHAGYAEWKAWVAWLLDLRGSRC